MRYRISAGEGRLPCRSADLLSFSFHFCLCIALDGLAWCIYPFLFVSFVLLYHMTIARLGREVCSLLYDIGLRGV
jgi:hypothetical protein